MTYNMTCTCGDVVSVGASTKEEAVEKMKAMMNEEAVAKHIAKKHPGDPVPTQEQVALTIFNNYRKFSKLTFSVRS